MTAICYLEHSSVEYLFTGLNHTETIVFLHGLGANLCQFTEQYNYFKKSYNVLLINLRGHGNSKVVGTHQSCDFQISNLAQDIVELLGMLEIEKAHFVGNSLGGTIGYELLNYHKRALDSLTTFGTTPYLTTQRFALLMLKIAYSFLPKIWIAKISASTGYTKKSKTIIEDMILGVEKSTLRLTLPNISDFDYRSVLKKTAVPILIIRAENDNSINKWIDRTVEEINPNENLKLAYLKNAGHFANLDQPEAFNQIVKSFIDNINE